MRGVGDFQKNPTPIIGVINPIKHIVEAARAIFRGEIYTSTTALGIGLAILIVVIAGFADNQVIKAQTK